MVNKKENYGIITLITVALVSVLAGIIITTRLDIIQPTVAEIFWKEGGVTTMVTPPGPQSFVELAEKLAPAVVNISTTRVVKERPMAPFPGPFEDFFGDEFKKFFGDPEREFKRQSLGSGFILNKEGYILTNNHVIENATEIIVTLSNNRKKEYEAEVVGKDANLDIALLRIDPLGRELHTVALGDSDGLKIGEWVVAIGNPFGLGGSVTAGIVSQKGRVIGAGPYDNFIQTDASINPGNSGGPLFNLSGEVVGVNTAIIAGGQGIGFATPVNMVKAVLVQLKEKGKVTRGWIGVSIQEITPELAASFGLEEPVGALVSAVIPGDPAEKAGIEPGDIIVEFDGKPIENVNDLPRTVAATAPGKKAEIKLIREGKEKVLSVEIAEKREAGEEAPPEEEEARVEERLGLSVQSITPEIAERFGIKDMEGVLVNAVKPGSPAADAGIRRGDIIKEINRKPVRNVDEYSESIKDAAKDDIILFLVGDNKGQGVVLGSLYTRPIRRKRRHIRHKAR
jgi:serine protease Do